MDRDEAEVEGERERAESFVVFQIGGERYALEVARVREVLDLGALTRVPGGSRALAGLCNLRGQVVPVWDLRALFRLDEEAAPAGRAPCVLMVEPEPGQPARVAGLLVDRVSDVLDVPPEARRPAPRVGLGGGSAFVEGLIRHQDHFLLIMDLDRVFAALAPDAHPRSA